MNADEGKPAGDEELREAVQFVIFRASEVFPRIGEPWLYAFTEEHLFEALSLINSRQATRAALQQDGEG